MGTKLQIEESVMAIVIYHHEILYIKELIYGMPKFSLPKEIGRASCRERV